MQNNSLLNSWSYRANADKRHGHVTDVVSRHGAYISLPANHIRTTHLGHVYVTYVSRNISRIRLIACKTHRVYRREGQILCILPCVIVASCKWYACRTPLEPYRRDLSFSASQNDGASLYISSLPKCIKLGQWRHSFLIPVVSPALPPAPQG